MSNPYPDYKRNTIAIPAQPEALYYPKHSARALGQDYINHATAMTRERLHEKSDIATQLAWRDAEIRNLRAANLDCVEHFNAIKAERDALLAVAKELQESAAYWSEYDVPLGIVDRLNAAIAKVTP